MKEDGERVVVDVREAIEHVDAVADAGADLGAVEW
jgi:hypothetical protein